MLATFWRSLSALALFLSLTRSSLQAQGWKLGADYGRAYFHFHYRDFGSGFSNAPKSNRAMTAQFLAERPIGRNSFVQTGIRFVLYRQYAGTPISFGAFETDNPAVLLPALVGTKKQVGRFELSVRGGMLLGFMPRQSKGRFLSTRYVDPSTVDSIASGQYYQNYGWFFPLINAELALEYRFADQWGLILRANGAKGFKTVSRYEVFYNNGSGRNDQYAEQWGTGDYGSATLGVTFRLLSKNR